MNIKGLQVYSRIMATGTLAAAAKSLNASESATSRQLSLLETTLLETAAQPEPDA